MALGLGQGEPVGDGLEGFGDALPFFHFRLQELVGKSEVLELLLHILCNRSERNRARQLLFASMDSGFDGLGVSGIGSELEVLGVMVNRGGRVALSLLVKPVQLEMSGSRARVDLDGFREGFYGSCVIHGAGAGLAGQEMGLLLLVGLAVAWRQAACQEES